MKPSFSLLQLSREELLTLADSRIPVSLASRVEAEALPPAFVARRSLELVRVVQKLGFVNTGTRVDEDSETVLQWVWKKAVA